MKTNNVYKFHADIFNTVLKKMFLEKKYKLKFKETG
jgi:hypothetical protein